MVQRFSFRANDKIEIMAGKWIPEGQVKGVVQIVHGMNEHLGRHRVLAEFLCSKGFAVYGMDLRGHGSTARKGIKGHFADDSGFEKVIDDICALTKIIKTDYPGKKLFIYGHSMGSFLVRNYLFTSCSEYNGVLLSGTGGLTKYKKLLDRIFVFFLKLFVNPDTKLPFLYKEGMDEFNRSFEPRRTDYDWLSTDPKVADEFLEDSMCNKINTRAFYCDLVKMMVEMEKSSNIAKIPKYMPIFLFSGNQDPVGLNGVKVDEAYEAYKKAGLKDVNKRIYPGLRHELHNEPSVKDQLFKDILAWIEKRL